LSYINTPAKGPMLTAAIQVPVEFFSFTSVDGKQTAKVSVAGSVFNDRGNPGAGFNDHLTIAASSVESTGVGDLTYGFPVYLGPGLYQARVGVRDDKTGKAGTAHGWIEIPDLSSGQLGLSSLLMEVRTKPAISNAAATSDDPANPIGSSISHIFSPNGYLRFLVFVYNAAPAPADAKPDVAVQVQVVRDGQPVVTTALKRVPVEGIQDLSRIPYAAEFSLGGLPAGHYLLAVTAVDRVAKKSASQRSRFEIQ
jgi:hypothetical protein